MKVENDWKDQPWNAWNASADPDIFGRSETFDSQCSGWHAREIREKNLERQAKMAETGAPHENSLSAANLHSISHGPPAMTICLKIGHHLMILVKSAPNAKLHGTVMFLPALHPPQACPSKDGKTTKPMRRSNINNIVSALPCYQQAPRRSAGLLWPHG